MKTRSQSKKAEASPASPLSQRDKCRDGGSQGASNESKEAGIASPKSPRSRKPSTAKKVNAEPVVAAAPTAPTAVVRTPDRQPVSSASAAAAGLRTPFTPRSALRQRDTPSKGGSVSLSDRKKKIPFRETSPSFSVSTALLEEKEEESDSPLQEKVAVPDEQNALPEKSVAVLVSGKKETLMLNPHANQPKSWSNYGRFERSEDNTGVVTFVASRKMTVNGLPLLKDRSIDLVSGEEYDIKYGQTAYKVIITDLTPVRLKEDEIDDFDDEWLRTYLDTRGLSSAGDRAELVERLKDAIRKERPLLFFPREGTQQAHHSDDEGKASAAICKD